METTKGNGHLTPGSSLGEDIELKEIALKSSYFLLTPASAFLKSSPSYSGHEDENRDCLSLALVETAAVTSQDTRQGGVLKNV